jgi:hypothetical protein
MRCAHCGSTFAPALTEELQAALARVGGIAPSAIQRFCTTRCRKRAFRRRRAGLPENAYPQGAARGRVPLTELTQAQERERWQAIAAELHHAREAAA